MKEVIAGQPTVLGCNVWDLSGSPSKPKIAGTIYVAVKLDKPGDTDDGKYWDDNDDTWQDAPVAWPTLNYRKGSWWDVVVPTAMTTGKAGGFLVLVDASDNFAAPLASTVAAQNQTMVGVVTTLRSLSGLYATTIHAHTSGGVSVSDMQICVYDSGLTNLLDRQNTDAAGNILTYLNAGTYKIRLAKAGYTTSTATITVTADATFANVVVPLPVPAAASPSLCTVYGYVLDGAGVAVDGEQIDFYGYAPLGVDSNVLVTTPVSVITGPSITNPAWPSGYFAIDLLRESQVRTASRLAKLDGLIITIPDSASSLLATLIEDAKT